MSSRIPESLQLLIDAPDDASRDRAWSAFLSDFSRLLLHVARAMSGEHDVVMDRYLFVLDALKRDNFRRLKSYSKDGRGSFTTWLVAVTRRLCVDEHRHRYGRPQAKGGESRADQRSNLVNLLSSVDEVDSLESPADQPDCELEAAELSSVLEQALDSLDASDRLLVRLRFDDGLAVPEIARMLGEPSPFRVYRRLDRLLSTLRQKLARSGIEGSTR
jgi:RNA polymerase sigma factor (sigma-70 family)